MKDLNGINRQRFSYRGVMEPKEDLQSRFFRLPADYQSAVEQTEEAKTAYKNDYQDLKKRYGSSGSLFRKFYSIPNLLTIPDRV